MVKFSTKLSFDVRLESKHVRETARIISKVLKVSKETIRTRLRKQTLSLERHHPLTVFPSALEEPTNGGSFCYFYLGQ